tara:strand:- start:50 stop:688 length:639 start_codon:yes stop_codon:yes gene_type:complete
MSEFGYIPESPEQSAFNNKGIFKPKDIYNLDQADKWTPQLGQLELIETKIASSDSALDFISLQENIYNVHFFTVNNYKPGNDNAILRLRFYESGVLETASVYQYAFQVNQASGVAGETTSTTKDYLRAVFGTGNFGDESGQSYNYLYNLGDNTKYSFQTMQGILLNQTPDLQQQFGSGVLPQASTVTGLNFTPHTGTNFSATISLYGIKEYS